MGANGQQYCLRWNDHRSNLLAVFDQLLQTEAFTDVTLACGGASIKCHKMVLAACSTYFQSLFLENTCSHPIVVFKDIQYAEIRAILEYMYRGEVNVEHEHLPSLLKVAAALKVKGLVDEDGQAEPEVVPRIPPPPPPKTPQPTSVQANTKRPESPPTSEASNQRPSYMYRNSIVNNSNPDLSLPVWSPLMMPLPMGVYESAMASLANNGPKRKRASGSEDSGRPNVVGQQGVTVEGPPLQAPPSRQEGHISDLSLQNYSYQRPQYERNDEDSSIPESGGGGGGGGGGGSDDDRSDTASEAHHGIPLSPGIDRRGDMSNLRLASYVPTQKLEWKRYKQYTNNDITAAIEAVKGGMSALQASRKFKVPSRTLYDKVKKMGIATSRPYHRSTGLPPTPVPQVALSLVKREMYDVLVKREMPPNNGEDESSGEDKIEDDYPKYPTDLSRGEWREEDPQVRSPRSIIVGPYGRMSLQSSMYPPPEEAGKST
ncbi:protein bric-a-brac 2-like isoform X2 [Artemia franciscana]